MAKLKLIIHPMFFLLGIYFALSGKVFSFLAFTFSALLHEFGHYLVSESLGYKLNRIVLMPFGAVISGDIYGLKYADELKIAFAGPLINLLTACVFVALWWLKPEIYPYTELAAFSSFALCTVNLIPAYPLDGGRILSATLSLYMPRKKALLIAKIIGVIVAVALFGLFVYSIFTVFNLTLLFLSSFMLFGALSKTKENRYIKIYSDISLKQLKTGEVVKKYIIDSNSTLKDVYRLTRGQTLFELAVVFDEGYIKTFPVEKTIKLLNGDIYTKLKDIN